MFGVCAGAGLQAWRNYPPEGPGSAEGLWVVLLGAVLLAYLAGRGVRARRGPVAVAQAAAFASAKADSASSSTVNVAFVMPGAGARPVGVAVPDDSMPWFEGQRAQLSVDQLDGQELSELVEESEYGR